MAWTAIAASIALPPLASTVRPACVAFGWAATTTARWEEAADAGSLGAASCAGPTHAASTKTARTGPANAASALMHLLVLKKLLASPFGFDKAYGRRIGQRQERQLLHV
ncbi:MAG: hypothetical protein COA64_14610, partial [Henriciella sp.]